MQFILNDGIFMTYENLNVRLNNNLQKAYSLKRTDKKVICLLILIVQRFLITEIIAQYLPADGKPTVSVC